MEDPFIPKSLSIQDLFISDDAWYQVPDYQRPYKWKDEEVGQLWEDLTDSWEASKNDDSGREGNYFLGSIVTSTPKQDTKYLDVVDGQQRLTTLMILFCVIRDLYNNPNENAKDGFAATSNIINEAIENKSIEFGKRYLPIANVRSKFAKNITNSGATSNLEQPEKSRVNGELPEYKHINSAVFFRNKLKEMPKSDAEGFITYLLNRVQVIRIDCKDHFFAIKLFQVINKRGLSLSNADLIKSFLLAKTNGPENSKQFVSDWSKTEDIASECYENMDNMLTLYLYYKLGDSPKQGLYEELVRQFKKEERDGKDSNAIFGDIKDFVDNYKIKLSFADNNKIIFSFWYIPWQMHWRSVMLTALQENYASFDELAKELRRFYYLYWIARKTLTKIKQTSFNVIKQIKAGAPIGEIVTILQKKIKQDEIVKDVVNNLNSDNISHERWIKPVFILLEYESKDDNKFVFLNSKLHLEHIFPQTPKSGWEHINKDVSEKHLNGAGNLTLLSGKKNIGASNEPFAEKIDFYKGLRGNSKGTTSFFITQKVISHHDAGKQWDEEAMRDRKKWFLEETAKLLDIEKELADYNKSNLNSPT